jgi:hypothetical protein
MATEFTAEYVTEAIGGGVKIEGGILRGAKMLGVRSKNKNRHYTPEAVKRSAHLYDGVPCNIDHAKDLAAGSSVLKRFGMWRNPRVVDGALIGDLHFNPEHVYAKQFIWAVENQPTTIGFSHVAKLNEKRVGKEMVVEGIEKVKSVDWVADPATTGGVFEDEEPENAPEEIPLTGRARGLSSLSDDQFAYVEPGGSRDGGGRTSPRSKRLFPLNNADAVRVALNAIPKLTRLPEEERTKALARAKSAAARFKITPFAKAASTSEGVMDLTGLTMEDFRAMRPDLVESLTKEAAVGDAVEKLTKENTELKKKARRVRGRGRTPEAGRGTGRNAGRSGHRPGESEARQEVVPPRAGSLHGPEGTGRVDSRAVRGARRGGLARRSRRERAGRTRSREPFVPARTDAEVPIRQRPGRRRVRSQRQQEPARFAA